jgi:hypothetical protein
MAIPNRVEDHLADATRYLIRCNTKPTVRFGRVMSRIRAVSTVQINPSSATSYNLEKLPSCRLIQLCAGYLNPRLVKANGSPRLVFLLRGEHLGA